MSNLTKQAEPAVKKLLLSDEGQLYEQLGIRAKAIAEDPTKSSSFEPEVIYDQAEMGLKEDVQEFGQRLFRRWNLEAHKLMCGSDPDAQKDREDLANAFGISDVAVAAALSALLVTYLGLAPAIAAVVAALAIKRFFRPAYEEFCVVWAKSLSQDE
jgi:hypothetical protein